MNEICDELGPVSEVNRLDLNSKSTIVITVVDRSVDLTLQYIVDDL